MRTVDPSEIVSKMEKFILVLEGNALYSTGKLTAETAAETSVEAYVHCKLAAMLFLANNASENAQRFEQRANELRALL